MFKPYQSTSRYKAFAEAAADLERCGNYKNAAFAWAGAAHQARNAHNQHWATSRSDYCYHRSEYCNAA